MTGGDDYSGLESIYFIDIVFINIILYFFFYKERVPSIFLLHLLFLHIFFSKYLL